ncbi:neuromedin-U receptor 1-like [Dendronephthya gigantea]|uniref:neuromedin-U receptor 1-like n=1 Tax=Dendronephthya gigantea TaxID=151771 RepID=UPI00106C0D1B|nr:neuromedin-U receptor 1-like [Dendronephthya gigantea]
MNLSSDIVVITCLHPDRVYQFGPAESYHFINIPLIVVNLFLLVFIILGNITVIMAYFRNTTLQSVPNMLLIILAFTDLFVGIVAQPLFIAILVRDVLGAKPLCWLALLSSVTLKFCGGASLMTLSLIISLERYFAICYPLKHRCWITKTRLKRAVGALWSFLLTLNGSLIRVLSYKAYFAFINILVFTAIAVTAFSCCGILMTLRMRKQKYILTVKIDGRLRSHGAASTLNNAKENDYKIAVTMFYIIAAIVVCYTPMFAGVVYAQVKSRDKLYLKYFYPITMTLMFLNSLLNPVIYCLRNKRFTNAIRKMKNQENGEQQQSKSQGLLDHPFEE